MQQLSTIWKIIISIALLDGRDKETVKSWLQNHKKIKIATRDRASAYANAISEVLPECTQIADRFHLLQYYC